MSSILRKASTFLLALALGFGAATVGKAAPAEAASHEAGYMVNVLSYGGDCALSLTVSAEYRWTVWVDGRTVARVPRRKADSPETTWFSAVINVHPRRKTQRVVMLRDGVRYFKMDISKRETCNA